MKVFRNFFILILCLLSLPVYAIQFRYTYHVGDQYRFFSYVDQEHGFLGAPLIRSEFINRLTFRVDKVDGNRGSLVGGQQTTEQRPGQQNATIWSKEYPVSFWRDEQGICNVAENLFVPMVRNVPYFPPGQDMHPGDEWYGKGEEVQDLSLQIGYTKPFRIPILVHHQYVGPVKKDGHTYHLIKVQYQYKHPIPHQYINRRLPKNAPSPEYLRGYFMQDLYWDAELNQPVLLDENYEMALEFSNRQMYIFKGRAHAYLIEAKPMDKQSLETELKEKLAQEGLGNVHVTKEEKGVKLSIENIQFAADSAQILPGQEEKLKKIGNIIHNYPDRDIAIVGHTALVRAVPDNGQALSEQRAQAVANFLAQHGYKKPKSLIVEGRGSREPVADGRTEQGRAKNRRVEITILEN